MTAFELQRELVERITEITDISFLKDIRTMIDLKAKTKVLALTEEQKTEIMESKKEIAKGLYIEHEHLIKEVSTWLKER